MKNEGRCRINYPNAYQPGFYLPREFTQLAPVKTNEHTEFCWCAI